MVHSGASELNTTDVLLLDEAMICMRIRKCLLRVLRDSASRSGIHVVADCLSGGKALM